MEIGNIIYLLEVALATRVLRHLLQQKLISIGGLVKRGRRPVLSEILRFNLLTNAMEEVKPVNLDRDLHSRRNHCGAILGDMLIVYGGLNT